MKEWDDLVSHIESNYHKPDIEALSATLSVATAHYFQQDEPIWLMVVGPPGTGKTSICIGACTGLPYVYPIDTLTPNTFLSGFSKGVGGNCSMLNNIGVEGNRSGILTMAEFSAFLGLREESRREIGSQMRRIYDGYLDKLTGVGPLEWHGKVTFIVAATSSAERIWGTMKDLGERFMTVRWPRGDGIEQAKSAQRQIGRTKEITERTTELVSSLCGDIYPSVRPRDISGEEIDSWGIAFLAEIIAISRAKIERDRSWKREIIDEAEPEGPTRIMKSMCQVATGHAALMRRHEINESDLKIARRLGMDSIPPLRLKLINCLRIAENKTISFADLCRRTGTPPTSLGWGMEELEALQIAAQIGDGVVERKYRLTDRFQELLIGSNKIFSL